MARQDSVMGLGSRRSRNSNREVGMSRIRTGLVSAVAAGLLAWPSFARAIYEVKASVLRPATDEEDEKLPLSRVPAKVMSALKAKYPKAEIVSAGKGDQDGTKVYEFELKQGALKWEAAFTLDAKFAGSEEVLKESQVPAPVLKAFRDKYPQAVVEEIEKAVTVEKNAEKVVYEFVMKTAKGKVEALFDPSGKFLSSEDVVPEKETEKEPK